MFYKKGSIIPRYLIKRKNRKTQYLMKFGADVEVTGRRIKMLSDGSAICAKFNFIGGRNGKPRIYLAANIRDLYVIGTEKNSSLINACSEVKIK